MATQVQQTYRRAWQQLQRNGEHLLRTHGPECACEQCQRQEERFIQLAQNPPCACCDGAGCGQCRWTGWR